MLMFGKVPMVMTAADLFLPVGDGIDTWHGTFGENAIPE